MSVERNGKVVGVDSSGDQGSMGFAGRGTCTVGQVGGYKTGAKSMVGQTGVVK